MTTYDIGGVTVDRRALIRLLGITAVGSTALLSGCALGGTDNAGGSAGGGTKSAGNPLGVNADAPMEFFNFEGGYGKDWPKIDATLYRGRYPKAKVTITGAQQMKQQLQPRFVGGNPPDLTSTNDLNLPALVQQGQLTPLEPLLAAASYDTPGKTVGQSLLPGVLSFGTFEGKLYAHPYVDGIAGIWYSKPLMESHGWTYPKTWDEMMALCVKIKAAGLAPWTYQGKYPGYLVNPMLNTAPKSVGLELGRSIDNLEANAWRNPAILATATRYHELAAKGFLLEGTTGLTHTQAQTYWAQRKVVFIPCGSWLENELGPIAPKDLGMSVDSPPSLSAIRNNARSPTPGTGAPRRCFAGRSTRMRGAAPNSAVSQSLGTASRSPSASRPVISATTTLGRAPARRRFRRRRASVPSLSMSLRRRFNSVRSPPLMPNARAISRFPILLSAFRPASLAAARSRCRKARMSSLVGIDEEGGIAIRCRPHAAARRTTHIGGRLPQIEVPPR